MIRLIGFEFGKIFKRRIVFAALGMLVVFGIMLYMGNCLLYTSDAADE